MTTQNIDACLPSVHTLPDPLCGAGDMYGKSVLQRESGAARYIPMGAPLPGREERAFIPQPPESLAQAKLPEAFVEALLLKVLLFRGRSTGADVARQIALPCQLLEKLLQRLKNSRLIELKGQASLNDYFYELTDLGTQQAGKQIEQCFYSGAAPVALEDYVAAVAAQLPQKADLNVQTLRQAFDGLTISNEMVSRIGRAVLSGRGLFLYGPSGNGKTSIAERITRVFGSSIWIPRAVIASGQIVRVFDPTCHEEVRRNHGVVLAGGDKFDQRWVRIRRPTLIVGGELKMESLDIVPHNSGVSEAPLQMKSNCGTLVIDDFGRQQISPAALLNRWIVPLEKRYDYLNLPSGAKLQVPFEQFVIFSTNLQPSSLVDEAFLRRIPFKIDVANPTDDQFRSLFMATADRLGIPHSEEMLDYLVTRHYRAPGREFRFSHPRDLLHHVAIYCDLLRIPRALSVETLDAAVGDYFATR
jgi:predicted ATPase with chaperone activity